MFKPSNHNLSYNEIEFTDKTQFVKEFNNEFVEGLEGIVTNIPNTRYYSQIQAVPRYFILNQCLFAD